MKPRVREKVSAWLDYVPVLLKISAVTDEFTVCGTLLKCNFCVVISGVSGDFSVSGHTPGSLQSVPGRRAILKVGQSTMSVIPAE